MSLFSNLLETFETSVNATGIVLMDEKGQIDEKKAFLPLFHTTFKSQICVTIDSNGNLIKIDRDNKDQTIIIPCTESSISRSGKKIAPHPLCDQLGYVDKTISEDKYNAYLSELEKWKDGNQKLKEIYNFITRNSIIEVLKESKLFKENEYNSNGELLIEIISKLGVRFSVNIPGEMVSNVWEDKNLQNLWVEIQTTEDISNVDISFDYLGGDNSSQIAKTHPKNLNPLTANAKLISCNDHSGFTYRGRFTKQDEATQIDYIASQKVHQTLKWLIGNFALRTEEQAIVIWAVSEQAEQKVKPFGNSYEIVESIFEELETIKSEADIISDIESELDKDYSKALAKILRGYGNVDRLRKHNKKIVIVIFDAATSGRMGVTFYQELFENEYLENIVKWHEESSWHLTGFKKKVDNNGKETHESYKFDGCPSFDNILYAVYGSPRGGNDRNYTNLKKKLQRQLLECMFGNFAFPRSLVETAAVRVSQPLSFTNSKGSFNEFDWRLSIEITCSLVKKYIKQHKKEVISMDLEEKRTDRDYLYGRLLAVADKLEQSALYKAGKHEDRATNAVRLMSSFSVKPYSTWGLLWKQLLPYINQLNGAGYFISIINEIKSLFEKGAYEDNSPLSPLYLLGYSHQTRFFSIKKEAKN